MAKVDRTGDGCWLWTGAVQSNGYAKASFRGRTDWAHRVAWRMANGDIPVGLHVCHHCDTPLCMRPDHMFLGTPLDNARDRNEKGRTAKGANSGPARRDYGLTCKRGHERATNTLYHWSSRLNRRSPYCGRCHAIDENARYHRSRVA